MKTSAIYITENSIRFLQRVPGGKGAFTLKEQEINIASIEKKSLPAALKDFLKENKIFIERLILGIPRSQVSTRHIILPSVNDNEIRKMVEFELNDIFPYRPQELAFDHAITYKNPEGYSEVMLAATRKEITSSHLSVLKEAGLVPDTIEISSISLFNQFLQEKREERLNYLLLNIENYQMDIVHLNQQRLAFSRGVNFNPEADMQELIKTIDTTLTVLRDKGYQIDTIILSGKGWELEDFAQGLGKVSPYPIEIDTTLNAAGGLLLENNARALRMDIMPNELKIKKNKEKRKRVLIYFTASLLLNVALLANIAFLQVKSKTRYLSALKSEIKKIDTQTSAAQKKMHKIQILRNYLSASRQTLGLFTEVYRLCPEGIFLDSLDISRKKPSEGLVIAGRAANSHTVLKFTDALKGSLFITTVDVAYIAKRKSDPQEMVNFEIKAGF